MPTNRERNDSRDVFGVGLRRRSLNRFVCGDWLVGSPHNEVLSPVPTLLADLEARQHKVIGWLMRVLSIFTGQFAVARV